ncbi:MAG: hypothetical protein A3E78_14220 [Alphaproteobacteria bacterium RIFCSPHIGHO2_12_FULL_63_12]|nr:MAG: hypothetical protein A3E78_14220 [Alphaproteobacteria bacterium RIFCSPHIGHO2_12_FULL_63_12]
MKLLLDGVTANGAGPSYRVAGSASGEERLIATIYSDPASNFDGGTATVQVSIDDSTWLDAIDVNGTAADLSAPGSILRIDLEANYVRAILAGAGGAADVTISLGARANPTLA